MKKIAIAEREDLGVKVRIESKATIGEAVDLLISMDDWEFKEAIKVAKGYRRANDRMAKALDLEATFKREGLSYAS